MNIFPAKKKGFIVHIHLEDETCMYTLFHKSLKYDQIKISFHESNLFYAIYFSSLIVGKSLKDEKALFGILNYNELIFHFVQPKNNKFTFQCVYDIITLFILFSIVMSSPSVANRNTAHTCCRMVILVFIPFSALIWIIRRHLPGNTEANGCHVQLTISFFTIVSETCAVFLIYVISSFQI